MLPERQAIVNDIAELRRQGARLTAACDIVGVSLRTYLHWIRDGGVSDDR